MFSRTLSPSSFHVVSDIPKKSRVTPLFIWLFSEAVNSVQNLTCSRTQIFIQLITWYQLIHEDVDMVEMTCWRSNKASQWGEKGDLDDFERGMVGLRILDTADLLEFSLTTIFSGLLRMIRKELLQFSGWKCLNVRGEWPGCNKQDIQKSISKCWTLKKDGLQKKILLGISSN